MIILKIILIILFCIPLALLIWRLILNVTNTVRIQQKNSEEIRKRKAAYQGKRGARIDTRMNGADYSNGNYSGSNDYSYKDIYGRYDNKRDYSDEFYENSDDYDQWESTDESVSYNKYQNNYNYSDGNSYYTKANSSYKKAPKKKYRLTFGSKGKKHR